MSSPELGSGGTLVRSRVVKAPVTMLDIALETSFTGYAVLEPQETVLLEGDEAVVLTFDDGDRTNIVHLGSGRSGPAALAALVGSGPYRLEMFAQATDEVTFPSETPANRMSPEAT